MACGSTAASAAISLSTRRASSSEVTRTSTRIVAVAGTTFSAVPAWATVGVTVVPCGRFGDRRDRQHLMGGLDEGVDPLLRLEPGVRGSAADLHGVHADALAADLQGTAVGRRLEHEHAGRTPPPAPR